MYTIRVGMTFYTDLYIDSHTRNVDFFRVVPYQEKVKKKAFLLKFSLHNADKNPGWQTHLKT